MKAKKFELFMGCLGNGITVCNKAVKEYGDYKTIAHIGNNGKIKWYVSEDYTPEEDKKRIEHAAQEQREKYLEWWNKFSVIQKYERLLDVIPHSVFMELVRDKVSSIEQKVERLEREYI